MFGPLLKIRLSHVGTVINPYCPEANVSGKGSVHSGTGSVFTSPTSASGAAGGTSVSGSTCIFSGLHSNNKVAPSISTGGSPRNRSPRNQKASDLFGECLFGEYTCISCLVNCNLLFTTCDPQLLASAPLLAQLR